MRSLCRFVLQPEPYAPMQEIDKRFESIQDRCVRGVFFKLPRIDNVIIVRE